MNLNMLPILQKHFYKKKESFQLEIEIIYKVWDNELLDNKINLFIKWLLREFKRVYPIEIYINMLEMISY